MAGYTTTEIEDAVATLLRTSLRRPTGVLGERGVTTTFQDLLETLGGLFLLTPTAPLRVIERGVRALEADMATAIATVVTLGEMVDAMTATTDGDVPTQDLVSARQALRDLETFTASAGTSGLSTTSPALARLRASLASFLAGPGQMVKGVSAVVPTPQEAGPQIPVLVTTLENLVGELVRRATLLVNALTDFRASGVAGVVARSLVTRMGTSLGASLDSMLAASPSARLAGLRATTLDVLTQSAMADALLAIQPGANTRVQTGRLLPFSNPTHPVNEVAITSDLAGPYSIVDGHTSLELNVDGRALALELTPSFRAGADTATPEPYDIHISAPGVDSTTLFSVTVNGTRHDFDLTPGHTRAATDIATELQAGIGTASGLEFSAQGQVGSQRVHIVRSTFSPGDKVLFPSDAGANALFGLVTDYEWTSQRTDATFVATDINSQTTSVVARDVFVPFATRLAHTDPTGTGPVRLRMKTIPVRITDSVIHVYPEPAFWWIPLLALSDTPNVLLFEDGPLAGTSWPVTAITSDYIEGTSPTFTAVGSSDTTVSISVARTQTRTGLIQFYARRAVGTITHLGSGNCSIAITDGQVVNDIPLIQVWIKSGLNVNVLTHVTGVTDSTTLQCQALFDLQDDTDVTVELIEDFGAFLGPNLSLHVTAGPNEGTYRVDRVQSDDGTDFLSEGEMEISPPTPDESGWREHDSTRDGR